MKARDRAAALAKLADEVVACERCPRLIEWCRAGAEDPPKRHRGETYHGGPVPGFGDPQARVVIVGLAPAANGANRTGRMFTGDRSGDWLYRALYKAGFASQAESTSADDGLRLKNCYITATCRCAPPQNKPTRDEIANCAEYLDRELDLFGERLRVIVALGSVGYKAALDVMKRRGVTLPKPRPKFGHGVVVELGENLPKLVLSFHPSQQNTFTGKLTEEMFDAVWETVRREAG